MKILVSLSFAIFSLTSFAGVSIISDLDDTIKITHVSNPLTATYNGIFKKNVFSGMPEFLDAATEYSNELHIVTASPPLIEKSVLRTLNSNSIKFDSVAFKNPFKKESKIDYKVRIILNIMENSSDDFLLIGDDVDKDPEIFDIIAKRFPEKILRSYIHVIRNRPIPAGLTPYFTTADLALREMNDGRLRVDSAERILDTMIDEENLKTIFPRFAFCPTQATTWNWQLASPLMEKAGILIDKFVGFCTALKR